MVKETKRLVAILLSIPIFASKVSSMANETEWKKIERYKTGIEVRGGILEIYPQKKEVIPKEIRNNLSSKYIKEYFFVDESDYIKLVKFFKNKKYEDTFVISKIVIADFIKNYSMFYIENPFHMTFHMPFVYAVEKKGKEIHRFRKAEIEVEPVIFDKIKLSDIKFFNKMMKKEKIKVKDPTLALDICILFVKMAFMIDNELIRYPEEIEKYFEEKYQEDKEKMLKLIKSVVHPPLYKKTKNGFEIRFITGFPFIYDWHFAVNKNGEIKLMRMCSVY